ncbi:MAG: sigma-70 family RNA polymerase sigma factor [Acidobacteria bacterium]|nr:sigma-70 family RNA polymerase sigma factor [Acidobacteriota bacterium]
MDPNVGALMRAAEQGEASAAEDLFAALYTELHSMAKRELARRGFAATLGVTTLLHEAYIDMAAREDATFPDRPRFMAYAAKVMRGLIIDHSRNRQAIKRGGQFEITSITSSEPVDGRRDLTPLGDALEELAKSEPQLAEIVDLKFFCGFSFAEIAAMRSVSERTVQRQWDKARIYLHRSVSADALR